MEVSTSPPPATRRSTAIERALVRRAMKARGHPPFTVVLWDGTEIPPQGRTSLGRVHFRTPRTLADVAINPDPGIADAYVDGRIEVEGDLVSLVNGSFSAGTLTPNRLRAVMGPLNALLTASSRRQARRNIHRHYDLGNDFYRLWLDERMQYTCAFFPTRSSNYDSDNGLLKLPVRIAQPQDNLRRAPLFLD